MELGALGIDHVACKIAERVASEELKTDVLQVASVSLVLTQAH